MALVKRVYADGNTVITAQNLNDIQDNIILNGQNIDIIFNDIGSPYDDTATYDIDDYCLYQGNLYKCIVAVTVAESFDPDKWVQTSIAEGLGSANIEVIAAEYDDTLTYDVGDYCTHDGVFYICTTAITVAEAWDDTHWSEVTVGEELTNLGQMVYVGTSTPTDPSVKIWLDTDEPGMSAVSSVNGKTGTVVIDDIPMTLLWENASPTSDFAAQTVQIDFFAYDFMMIEMKSNTTSDAYFTFIGEAVTGHKGFLQKVTTHNSGAAVTGIERQFTLASNGVDFTRAFNYIGNTTVNNEMIPYRIFGIKKG